MPGSWVQQEAALEQGEACLPIGTAFDQFYLVMKPFDHAIAPGFSTGVGYRLGVVGQSLDKASEFLNATLLHGGFPVLEALHPLPLSQQVTKLLGEGEGDGNRGIELSDVVNESELLLGPMGRRTHHHQRHGARGRGFALRHGLSADGFGPVGTQLGHDPINRTPRSGIALSHDLFV